MSPKPWNEVDQDTAANLQAQVANLQAQVEALTRQVDQLSRGVTHLTEQTTVDRLALIQLAGPSPPPDTSYPLRKSAGQSNNHRLGMVHSRIIDALSPEQRIRLVNDIRNSWNKLNGSLSKEPAAYAAYAEAVAEICSMCFIRNGIVLEYDWSGRGRSDIANTSLPADMRFRMLYHYSGYCFNDGDHKKWYKISRIIETFHRVAEYLGVFEEWT